MSRCEEMFTDAVIKKACYEYANEIGKKYIEEAQELNKIEENWNSKNISKIRRQLRRFKMEKKSKKVSYREIKFYRTAMIVTIFVIAFNVSVVSVPAMKKAVVNYLMETFDEYTKFSKPVEPVENDYIDKSEEYVIDFDKEYIFTYLPKDFKILEERRNITGISRDYYDNDENWIVYSQMSSEAVIHLDTEDRELKNIYVNGNEAVMAIDKERKELSIIWAENDEFIKIESKGISEEEFLKVVKSLRRINE